MTLKHNLKTSLCEVRLERDKALEWVKENLMKGVPDGKDKDFKADGLCHAIQVFINRVVIPKLEGSIEELQQLKQMPFDDLVLTGLHHGPRLIDEILGENTDGE